MQSPAPLTFLAATKRPHEHPMGLRSGPGPRMVQAVQGCRLDMGQVCPAAPLYHQVLTGPVLVEWGQTKTQTYRPTCMQACTCVLQHFITCTDTAATTVNYSIFPNTEELPRPRSHRPLAALWHRNLGETAANLPRICGLQRPPSILTAVPLHLRAP